MTEVFSKGKAVHFLCIMKNRAYHGGIKKSPNKAVLDFTLGLVQQMCCMML
jgi:hypothetical protein